MRRVMLSMLITWMLFSNVLAQSGKVRIDVDNEPLNQVFFFLRDEYGFQFSFSDSLLAKSYVTVHRDFDNKEKAISFLVSKFPLSYEINGDVFVIFPTSSGRHHKTTQIRGQVVETRTFEPLPFSNIIINKHQVQADKNGDFNFLASADTTFNLQISHLGYFVYDTLLTTSSLNRTFFLTPSVKQLGEVKIEGFTVEKSALIGDEAGKMKINHTIAPYLPGNGDNSVYTVLRLMPGVLASGEQSSDLVIWGSYESQTKIEFDGMTVFGLNNQNDNIGVVNPLLIKDIRVLKGGYEANYDDRVGGMVEISGKNGNQYRPSFTFNINNTTLNTLAEVPIGRKSSVLAAYRQTYYNLYNPFNFNLYGNQMESGSSMVVSSGMHSSYSNMVDVLVIPDYKFRDVNLKYSLRGNSSDVLTVGFYGGGDRFKYNIDGLSGYQDLQNHLNETDSQFGVSASYSRPWGRIFNSSATLSYSSARNDYEELNSYVTGEHTMMHQQQDLKTSNNEVGEINAAVSNTISFKNGLQFTAGIGYQQNDIQLKSKTNDVDQISVTNNSQRFNLWLQGHLQVGKSLELRPGLRAGYENLTKKNYSDPRISASLRISKAIKWNAAWGRYHQFLSKPSFVDTNQNYSWYWVNANGTTIPDMSAWHWVSGISYNKNDFLISVEGYLKTTSGITRYYEGTDAIGQGYYSGNSRSYGVDFYMKKEYKKNVAWISYTVSKTEEHLSYNAPGVYQLAPHDQRHELKMVGIYNLKSFYFSANYVYGSGFEIMKNFSSSEGSIPEYSRFDAAVIYKFNWKKIPGNLGVSVLNVFNHPNIKYANLRRIESGTDELLNVHTEAVPFTPTIFLKFKI